MIAEFNTATNGTAKKGSGIQIWHLLVGAGILYLGYKIFIEEPAPEVVQSESK